MTQKPYLNLGCGRVILPAAKPAHYGLIDDITDYALWHNVDRNAEPGVDEVLDIFRYPFPWADNSFDGALLAHIAEHIPHEIRTPLSYNGTPVGDYEMNLAWWSERTAELQRMQDGWYAFFAELHRVLTPGSIIHVLSPYAWSQGGVTDPTHTRLITEHTFTHSLQPDPRSPFRYEIGALNLELVEPVRFTPTMLFAHLRDDPEEWIRALQTRINVAYELYGKLRVIK